MNWYRKAMEEEDPLTEEVIKEYSDNILRKKTIEDINSQVKSAILEKVPSLAVTPGWWKEHVSPVIMAKLQNEGWRSITVENTADLAGKLSDAALIGNTTTTWNWMDQSLEWDSLLFDAVILLIRCEWVHDENSLELALECYDGTTSEYTPGNAHILASEIRLRMMKKEKAEEYKAKTWYVKAMGYYTYNKSGVTYPSHVPVNWKHILRNVSKPRWANQFGWNNQPKVLVFEGTNEQATQVGEELPDGLQAFLHWKYDPAYTKST